MFKYAILQHRVEHYNNEIVRIVWQWHHVERLVISLHIFRSRHSAAAVFKPMLQSQGQPNVCSSKHYHKSFSDEGQKYTSILMTTTESHKQAAGLNMHTLFPGRVFSFGLIGINITELHAQLTRNFLRTFWQGSL